MSSSATTVLGAGPGVTEVSREFLAALPLAIQEEVKCTEQNLALIDILLSAEEEI